MKRTFFHRYRLGVATPTVSRFDISAYLRSATDSEALFQKCIARNLHLRTERSPMNIRKRTEREVRTNYIAPAVKQ
jgi:hypothetical protein